MIYVKEPVTTSIKDFIIDLLITKLSPSTYKDKDCQFIQCAASRKRSFRELLDMVNTYFEGDNSKELAYVMVDLCNQDVLRTIPCATAKDIVFGTNPYFPYNNHIDYPDQQKTYYTTHTYEQIKQWAKEFENEVVHN